MKEIMVTTNIKGPLTMVWKCWNESNHVQNWNFASSDWHCPTAESDFTIGGEFHYMMAAKDGSFSFDFWGTFMNIQEEKSIEIILGDGRKMSVLFEGVEEETIITEIFEPEEINSIELQKGGWQAILDNFKKYAEGHF
jgi:uncharacterized protein YndB with AHSA1/START domain